MKRKGPEGQNPLETGPFRKMIHTDEENDNLPLEEAFAIKEMKKKIAAEKGKVGFPLPENLEQNTVVPFFAEAIETKVKPEDIIFYSLATGILKYQFHDQNPPNTVLYKYYDPNNLDVGISILLTHKKGSPATIFGVSPKMEVMMDKIRDKKNESRAESLHRFERNIQDIQKLVRTCADEETRQAYNLELNYLNTALETILNGVRNSDSYKLEEKKPKKPNTIK